MLGRLYRWFWEDALHLPEPITHIIREEQAKAPLFFLLATLLGGIFLGRWLEGYSIIWFLIGNLIGVVAGHFFWGGKDS